MPCLYQSSRRPREERDVSQCESVASTVSAQEDEDIEASNEEENPEDSEGNFSGKETFVYAQEGMYGWCQLYVQKAVFHFIMYCSNTVSVRF